MPKQSLQNAKGMQRPRGLI